MDSPRWIRRALGAGALVLALALAGCQAAPTAAPSPTASAATTAPTPSETSVTVNTPTPPFDGGCAELLADPGIAAATGGATALPPGERWWIGIETAGGLDCPFDGARGYGHIIAVPADAAVSPGFDAPGCYQQYEEVECVSTETVAGIWVLVALIGGELAPEVPDALVALQAAASAALSDADGVGVTARASTASLPLDCSAFADAVDVPTLLAAEEVFSDRIEEGSGPLDRRVAEALGVSGRCDWSELTDFREFGVVVYPGAAWTWPGIDLPEAEEVEVAGLDGLLSVDRHAGATLIVTDGVNLIEVRGSGVGREDLLAAAERITTAVSGA